MACARTVLLVDDSSVARHLVARRLRAEGFELEEASSLDAARRLGTQAMSHLVGAVLDLELGDGTGVELAVWLRAERPSLPIAFFTAAESRLVEDARAFGPVFAKVDAEPLVSWVRSLAAAHPPPTK
jgi:DNA-binding response OmpR family regulator